MIYLVCSFFLFLFWLPFFWPTWYISELIVSFLPYVVVASFLFSLFLLLFFLTSSFRGWVSRFSIFFLFCLYVLVGLIGLLSLWRFYFSSKDLWKTFSSDVTLLYANVYVENFDYLWLRDLIIEYNPDILVFVEYWWHHFEAMQEFLYWHFSYINRDRWDRGYDGTLIASRYAFMQKPVFVRGFLDLERYYSEDLRLDLSVVHTAAPVSYLHYLQRWQQLDHLLTHFSWLDLDFTVDPKHYVVLWDFNLSPWSQNYTNFVSNLSLWRTNLTKHVPFVMTWSAPVVGFLQSHIDHVFIKNLAFSSVSVVPVPWSDHNGFFVHLSVNLP